MRNKLRKILRLDTSAVLIHGIERIGRTVEPRPCPDIVTPRKHCAAASNQIPVYEFVASHFSRYGFSQGNGNIKDRPTEGKGKTLSQNLT
jgi:hypothetical protein